MDLGNLVEIVVHYLLIGGMTCLDHRDGFPMVSALVCTIIYWKRPIVNHNLKLSIVKIHQTTILYGLSSLKGY